MRSDRHHQPLVNDNAKRPPLDQSVLAPRRSGRVVRQPIHYEHEGEIGFLVSDTNQDDPSTYKDAMDDSDKEKWLEAMNQEMESMYSNSVWELVDPPEHVRSIGCKWIYKKKRGIDGKIETFKARCLRPNMYKAKRSIVAQLGRLIPRGGYKEQTKGISRD